MRTRYNPRDPERREPLIRRDPCQNEDWQFKSPIISVDLDTGKVLAKKDPFGKEWRSVPIPKIPSPTIRGGENMESAAACKEVCEELKDQGETNKEQPVAGKTEARPTGLADLGEAKSKQASKMEAARKKVPKEVFAAELVDGMTPAKIAKEYGIEPWQAYQLKKDYGLETVYAAQVYLDEVNEQRRKELEAAQEKQELEQLEAEEKAISASMDTDEENAGTNEEAQRIDDFFVKRGEPSFEYPLPSPPEISQEITLKGPDHTCHSECRSEDQTCLRLRMLIREMEGLQKEIAQLKTQLKVVARFADDHRHNLIGGLYTEKGVV